MFLFVFGGVEGFRCVKVGYGPSIYRLKLWLGFGLGFGFSLGGVSVEWLGFGGI